MKYETTYHNKKHKEKMNFDISFFLNTMGRKIFTKRVLDDLHLVEC